jgi:hypothetical protein
MARNVTRMDGSSSTTRTRAFITNLRRKNVRLSLGDRELARGRLGG